MSAIAATTIVVKEMSPFFAVIIVAILRKIKKRVYAPALMQHDFSALSPVHVHAL